MEARILMWISLCLCTFLLGLWVGFVTHEQMMFNGAVKIAEGLEGTTFNIEVDFNETEVTNAFIKYFNETIVENGTINDKS